MPSQDSASACQSLISKTIPFLHRAPTSTREINYGQKEKICSSEIWGVALWAKKQQPGTQEIDFSNQQLIGFLQELAAKGLPVADNNDIEISDVCDGVIYSFSKI